VATLFAATAGYEIVAEVGVETIRAWSLHLTERLRADLESRGFTLYGPRASEVRGGTLTVELRPEEDGAAFVRALADRSILVDHRPEAGLRVSPHFYTREEELAQFAEALSELRAKKSWTRFATAGARY
jgi:kynureninase